MSPEDVRDRVEAVRALAGDSEAAHVAEDRLHRDVLLAIARGEQYAQGLAQWALETTTIMFERWYA